MQQGVITGAWITPVRPKDGLEIVGFHVILGACSNV
jgi:hypothetical protein